MKYSLFRRRISPEDTAHHFMFAPSMHLFEKTHLIAIEMYIDGQKYAHSPVAIRPSELRTAVKDIIDDLKKYAKAHSKKSPK